MHEGLGSLSRGRGFMRAYWGLGGLLGVWCSLEGLESPLEAQGFLWGLADSLWCLPAARGSNWGARRLSSRSSFGAAQEQPRGLSERAPERTPWQPRSSPGAAQEQPRSSTGAAQEQGGSSPGAAQEQPRSSSNGFSQLGFYLSSTNLAGVDEAFNLSRAPLGRF